MFTIVNILKGLIMNFILWNEPIGCSKTWLMSLQVLVQGDLTKKVRIWKTLFIGSPLLLRNWEFGSGVQSKTIS